MTSKIEFYREVLLDDPNSRVFFPLAKMLAEQGEAEEAVSVLKAAIGFHPGHLEARFLLVELLSRLGLSVEASAAFEGLSSLLSNYPSVWTLWASKATGLSRDSSLALRLLAHSLQGQDVSWLELMERGMATLTPLSTLTETGRSVEDEASPEQALEDFTLRGSEEVQALAKRIQAQERRAPRENLPPECTSEASQTVKTRTMADLLASHGDFTSALDIYFELLRLSGSGSERKALVARIEELKALAEAGPSPAKVAQGSPSKSKAKLVSMLEALANRLDARATA
jgi:tetratricopeptide (TPR) repeat protein